MPNIENNKLVVLIANNMPSSSRQINNRKFQMILFKTLSDTYIICLINAFSEKI